MKQEYTDYLKSVYPELYDNGNKYGGFAIGDGWFQIINQLSQNIKSHMQWAKDAEPVKIEQIKEKFGTLRFYFQGGDDYVRGLVSMAESMSGVTCEGCGDLGESRGNGWIHVYCNTCEAEREMAKAKEEEKYAKSNGLEL